MRSSYCVIVWVRVVLKRTVVGDHPQPEDHTIQSTDTPGFKPVTEFVCALNRMNLLSHIQQKKTQLTVHSFQG